VCTNIRSDYQLYAKVKQVRKRYQSDPVSLAVWNQKINRQMYQQLREKRSTVCTGYAYLIRTLAYHAGIACKLVDGYARSSQSNVGGPGIPNHSWNAVRIDSVWYLSDATWSSGQVYEPNGFYIPNFRESYFLVQPSSFLRSHYPLDTAHLFLRDKPVLTDFLNAPLVYAASYDYAIRAVAPATFFMIANKDEPVQFVVQQERGIPFRKLALHVNDTEVTSIEAGCEEAPSRYSLTHTFSSRGMVAVHIVADGQPVYSYRIKVK
jgi:transglutaminase/protease-like cytokinesis protein 3